MTDSSPTANGAALPADPLTVPVGKTLLERFRLLGVDRRWTVIEIAIALLFAFGLRNGTVLAAPVVTHFLLWLACRRDPEQIACYLRYRRQGDHYEPRHHPRQRLYARPLGFARGLPC